MYTLCSLCTGSDDTRSEYRRVDCQPIVYYPCQLLKVCLTFTGDLVSLSWVITCVKREIALDATSFCTNSSVKQLSPADVVLLADQKVKLWRILLIGNGETVLGSMQ